MERHDAAIIGAGFEGLIAAILLARANRRVVLLERQPRMGGRAETREFHPGFKASPYADELPAIPSRLFRALDLTRHGAVLMPAPASVCISAEGTSVVFADSKHGRASIAHPARAALSLLRREVEDATSDRSPRDDGGTQHEKAPVRVLEKLAARRRLAREHWGQSSLDEMLKSRIPDAGLRLHLAANAVSGRAVSPFLAGTALHLLAPGVGCSGMAAGALGTIGAALMSLAANAGAVIRCGVEVQAIRISRGRSVGVVLANGEAISVRAVLSTLDVKRTFLDLVPRAGLPAKAMTRIGRLRTAGQAARVLIALDSPPIWRCRAPIRHWPWVQSMSLLPRTP
jgi:phytoene dehydrogenase-like protein